MHATTATAASVGGGGAKRPHISRGNRRAHPPRQGCRVENAHGDSADGIPYAKAVSPRRPRSSRQRHARRTKRRAGAPRVVGGSSQEVDVQPLVDENKAARQQRGYPPAARPCKRQRPAARGGPSTRWTWRAPHWELEPRPHLGQRRRRPSNGGHRSQFAVHVHSCHQVRRLPINAGASATASAISAPSLISTPILWASSVPARTPRHPHRRGRDHRANRRCPHLHVNEIPPPPQGRVGGTPDGNSGRGGRGGNSNGGSSSRGCCPLRSAPSSIVIIDPRRRRHQVVHYRPAAAATHSCGGRHEEVAAARIRRPPASQGALWKI